MTEILLIRHAVNDYVKTGRLAGWTPGVHLNEEGRAQADALAQRLDQTPLHALYSSPLDRAIETAEPLARAKGLAIRVVDGIGEVQYGDWTGGELKELAKQELWRGVQHYPSVTRFPSGETMAEMQARAVAQVEAICAAHPEAVVAIVSHGDVIKSIIAHYVGLHLDLFQRLDIAPASLTWIHLGQGGPRLVVLNETGSVPRVPERKADAPTEAATDTAAAADASVNGSAAPTASAEGE